MKYRGGSGKLRELRGISDTGKFAMQLATPRRPGKAEDIGGDGDDTTPPPKQQKPQRQDAAE